MVGEDAVFKRRAGVRVERRMRAKEERCRSLGGGKDFWALPRRMRPMARRRRASNLGEVTQIFNITSRVDILAESDGK